MTEISPDLSTEVAGNNVLDYGDQALMLQCASTAEVLAWVDALRDATEMGLGLDPVLARVDWQRAPDRWPATGITWAGP